VATEIGIAVMPMFLTLAKWGLFFIIFIAIMIGGIFLLIHLKRRKWYVDIVERKEDGSIQKVKEDVLIERKLAKGTITVYWLSRTKVEVIPPPEECITRWKKKDYVTYRRIERDYIPVKKKLSQDFSNPEVNNKIAKVYDSIIRKVRAYKTSMFDSEPVRDRFMYIPANRTLSSNFVYRPIDYDMSMMAQNKIQHADEFFKMKGEWWAKYGAYVLFFVTIVFLIIVIALTYEFIAAKIGEMLAAGGNVASALEKVASGLGNTGGTAPRG